jgi:hypothetical protein
MTSTSDGVQPFSMKGKVQSQQQKNISYRSYKNFDVDIFNSELNQVAFHCAAWYIGYTTYVCDI